METRAIFRILLGIGIGTGAARAQVAASGNYALVADEFAPVVGGASSPDAAGAGRAGFGTLGSTAPGEGASPNRQAFSGFLHMSSPFGGSGPLVFGVSPSQGPTAGGTLLQLQGVRFQGMGTAQFGSAGVLVFPISATRYITASPPSAQPIPAGPVSLTVTNGAGSTEVRNGFLYLPTLLASDDLVPGGDVLVRTFGPAGNGFGYAMALASAPPFPFPGISGFLQLNLATLAFLRASTFFPDGTREFRYPTPPSLALSGLTVYWQSILFPPSFPEFSDLVSTTFL